MGRRFVSVVPPRPAWALARVARTRPEPGESEAGQCTVVRDRRRAGGAPLPAERGRVFPDLRPRRPTDCRARRRGPFLGRRAPAASAASSAQTAAAKRRARRAPLSTPPHRSPAGLSEYSPSYWALPAAPGPYPQTLPTVDPRGTPLPAPLPPPQAPRSPPPRSARLPSPAPRGARGADDPPFPLSPSSGPRVPASPSRLRALTHVGPGDGPPPRGLGPRLPPSSTETLPRPQGQNPLLLWGLRTFP